MNLRAFKGEIHNIIHPDLVGSESYKGKKYDPEGILG